uniref:Uncharacterized protein n=1 Tax=Ciona savignyi TaxID=51511 RepID=H2YJR0_CIOSA
MGRQLEEPLKIIEKCSERVSTIPAGTNVSTSIFMLHRHENFWENPTVFNPERFTKENIAKRPAFAYVPFSAGSRNCIGQNFAMNEMKICLAQVIRKLRLYIDGDSPVPKMLPRIILQSESGIFI